MARSITEIQADLAHSLRIAFGAPGPCATNAMERSRELAVELGEWCDRDGVIARFHCVGDLLAAIAGRGQVGSYTTDEQAAIWEAEHEAEEERRQREHDVAMDAEHA